MHSVTRGLVSIAVVVWSFLTGFAWAGAPATTDRAKTLATYGIAVDAGRFDAALTLTVAGCERFPILHLCEEVTALLLQMASQDVVPPARYGAEQRRIAVIVCVPDKRMVNSKGADLTGFICNYYAGPFAHAYGPARERAFLFRPWQYLDEIHVGAYSRKLSVIACKHDSPAACARLLASEGKVSMSGMVSSH